MTTQIKALSEASQSILLELSRFLLQNEMTYKEFAAFSKWAFAQAGTEILEANDQLTTNRLMELTGLTRNDIAQAEISPRKATQEAEKTWTDAMRGLHKWHTRIEFLSEKGEPILLNLNDRQVFGQLFEITDVAEQKKLLLHLVDAGSVTKVSADAWKASTRYYIPKNKVLKFHYFGRAVSRLVSTLNRNINNPNVDSWIERTVSSKDLKPDARPFYTRVSKEQALRFVESLDDWTSSNEYATSPFGDTSQNRVGLGVYYFEEET